MPGTYSRQLAPAGTTGNNTHAITDTIDAERVASVLIVEAVGATPTVTWILEGSFDGTNWFAAPFVDHLTDTASFAATSVTAVGAYVKYLWGSPGEARFFKFYRVRTTANTNVTYRCELHFQEKGE